MTTRQEKLNSFEMTKEKDKGISNLKTWNHQNAEHASIKEKNDKSKNSIKLLQAHLEKGTCPKSLSYNVKVNTMPDQDFKSHVSYIKKMEKHVFVGALGKFHHRRIKKLTIKLEQERKQKRNHMEFTRNVKPVAKDLNSSLAPLALVTFIPT